VRTGRAAAPKRFRGSGLLHADRLNAPGKPR
jgi:hypothetical protein